jgi:hypothetical protein
MDGHAEARWEASGKAGEASAVGLAHGEQARLAAADRRPIAATSGVVDAVVANAVVVLQVVRAPRWRGQQRQRAGRQGQVAPAIPAGAGGGQIGERTEVGSDE